MSRFLWIFLPILIAYADTWKWMWDRAMEDDGYYSHAPLLVVVAAWVVWKDQKVLASLDNGPSGRGLWLLLGGLALRFFGAATTVDSLSSFSLLLTLPGAVWLCFGGRYLVRVLPVLMLLLFASPPPMDITNRVAFEMKEIAVGLAVDICNLFGLEATRVGAHVKVPGHVQTLEVADACSGLRSLLALTTLGYCLAFFMGSSNVRRRVVLLAVAAPAAVVTNVIRIVGICFVARYEGVQYASTTGHDYLNAASWIIDIVFLLTLDHFLDRERPAKKKEAA